MSHYKCINCGEILDLKIIENERMKGEFLSCSKCKTYFNPDHYKEMDGIKKMKFQWELIDNGSQGANLSETTRLKVFGGWIVNHLMYFNDCLSESSCFVPDKNHEWKID